MKSEEKQIKIIEGKEKQKILEILNNEFGIEKLNGKLIVSGKEKIFFYTGNLTNEQLRELEKFIPIERVGVYLAKNEEGKIRLSIEGSQILKNEIKKNIVELNKNEMEIWMMGHELLKKTDFREFVILKYKEDFLGTGKASAEKINNFIPKSRRLKDKTIKE